MCKAYDHKEVKKMKKYEVMFIVKPTLAEEDVNKVVEKDALDDAVNKMCDTLLKKDPFALGMIKKIIRCTMDLVRIRILSLHR